ncbi:hypothetical protein DOJK_01953 [Patescibacteria group bacterium]|jgi:hypothetical protein|nr:hypothetical protein DOJK_01953 [Patescibacteria group bacterium]
MKKRLKKIKIREVVMFLLAVLMILSLVAPALLTLVEVISLSNN